MQLRDEGSVHGELVVVELEGGRLDLNIDRQARCREEVVELAVAAAKVGATAVGEVEMGVLQPRSQP